MRRWLGRLAACCLLAVAAAGCHHTAGVCDCEVGHCPLGANGGVMGHHAALSSHPAAYPGAVISNGSNGPAVTTAPAPRTTPPMTKVND